MHQETFGKSGCRRIVPGQYLAIDPKGRSLMVGAVEKQKLVYILNRDAEARLTISSPLEAHKSNTLTYHMVGVDVGFENPMFACLEIDYEKSDSDPTGKFLSKNQILILSRKTYFICGMLCMVAHRPVALATTGDPTILSSNPKFCQHFFNLNFDLAH